MTDPSPEVGSAFTRATIYKDRGPSAPDNELPALLGVGPAVWRGAEIAIAVTAFLVYSTGAEFTILGRSARTALNEESTVKAVRRGLEGSKEREPETLRFGVQGLPVTPLGGQYQKHSFRHTAWVPLPAEEDIVLFMEWPAAGIEYSEFRIAGDRARCAADRAVVLWPPATDPQAR
jgi:hypothetical protein